MMVMDLRHTGTNDWLRDVLKMSVRTPASWLVQSLSKWAGMLLGPAAVCGLNLERVLLTSAVERQSTWSVEEGVAFLAGSLL